MGLGGQLTAWPEGFVDGLRDRGFFVIRFDNRDCGLSTKFEGMPDILALFTGDPSSAPYRVEDMADDAAALLEHLGIDESARRRRLHGRHDHAGAGHPSRRALPLRRSIMSTTGDRSVGAPTGEAMTALLRPMATSRDEAIEASVAGSQVIGSPKYPTDEGVAAGAGGCRLRPLVLPRGHRAAAGRHPRFAGPHRGAATVRIPFLVLHGEEDPLVTLEWRAGHCGGRARCQADHDPRHGTRPARGACGPRSPTPSWRTRSSPRQREHARPCSAVERVGLSPPTPARLRSAWASRLKVSRSTPHDAEAGLVAERPLEVVEQRPVGVPADVDAGRRWRRAHPSGPGGRSRCAARRRWCRSRSR